ncbi:MAG: DUF1848 domain-containing protein [Methanolinea sp.]|nr:DUF1848 domain-containing protein [Methanolinea sp.]
MPRKKRAGFTGWERVTIRDDRGTEREAIAPVIVSASRSTDIPAFYGDWFVERLRRGHAAWVNPWNGNVQYVSFAKTRAIVFWSKNPAPFLEEIDVVREMGYSVSFLYTLNDYRQESLEPRVPPLPERVRTFARLSSILGPARVTWRYDPLLLSDSLSVDDLLSRVESIGASVHRYTRRLVVSFVDIAKYPRVQRLLSVSGHTGVREFSPGEVDQFCAGLADIASGWNLDIYACGEERDLSSFGIHRGECISASHLASAFPGDRQLLSFLSPALRGGDSAGAGPLKDPGQRRECGCVASKDIGRYSTCMHLCAYCYANASPEEVRKNWERHAKLREAGFVPEAIGGLGEGI